jgi:protein TonB
MFAERRIRFSALCAVLLVVLPACSSSSKNPSTAYEDSCQGESPPYPEKSKKAGETGTVVLRLQIGANGTPESVVVVKSTGYARLDSSASWWIMTCRWKPWTPDATRPQSATHDYTFSFSLDQ